MQQGPCLEDSPGLQLAEYFFNQPIMDPIVKLYIDLICDFTGVPYNWICSKSRKRKIREARHLLIYALVMFGGKTLSFAGSCVNRRHSTAHCTIKRVSSDLESNKDYRKKYAEFLASIENLEHEKEAEKKGIHVYKKGDQCWFWNHINEEPIFGILQEIDKAGKLAYAENYFAPFRFWKLVTTDDRVPQTLRIKRTHTVLAS
jgi:hypothetical protein